MRYFRASLKLFALLAASLTVSRVSQAQWKLGGEDAGGYLMTATGSALLTEGATLTLSSKIANPNGLGTVTSSIPVGDYAGKRVRISAEFEKTNADALVAVLIRADSGARKLIIRNSLEPDLALRPRTAPGIEAVVDVPKEATHLTFGLMLNGAGSVTARNVKLVALTPEQTSSAAQFELDSAISLVKRRSLWRDTVTWSTVEPLIRSMAKGAQSTDEVAPAIRELLARLGDHHSLLMTPQRTTTIRTMVNPPPTVRVHANGMGYISIPAYGGGDRAGMEAYVRNAYDSLTAIVARGGGACRWIVDVRGNGGGNMWPMLAALRPFLGDVALGTFVRPEGISEPWKANAYVNMAIPAELSGLQSANVAVLTGPRTMSSGEAVTIAFVGRPNTRSFGLPTGGLASANTSTPLPSGAMLVLTTAVDADRNGKKYGYEVYPDEMIGLPKAGATSDPQVDRAVSWLTAQACR